VCPIDVSNEYDEGLSQRKAIYKRYPQAIPGGYAISKLGTAPCKATCPAHVSIQGYIALINEGKYAEALKLFKQDHPFPGVCGRVCHHPCEGVCTRNDVDQPLAIRELHRFLADWEKGQERPWIPDVEEQRSEKVAIIGSGPAGLTTAYYLALKGYQVTIFEKLPVAGGMMSVGIPEYRLPRDILSAEIRVIEQMGVTIRTGVTFGEDISFDSLKADGFAAVFLAIGLHGGRKLGVENEEVEGVLQGVDFLRDSAMGKDVAIGDDVLVVGGGNVAIDVALTAKRKGAKKVTMVCLEKREEMPAWEHEIQEALESDIEIVNSFGPKTFFIDKSSRVSGIEFKTCTAVFDEEGRFRPRYDEDACTPLFGDTVIISIGQSADLGNLRELGVATTPVGGLETDPLTLQTPIEWVFAGGDAVYGPKSVVDAVACGKEASESIHRFLNGMDLRQGREKLWDFEKPDVAGESKQPRVPVRCLDPTARECNFLEVSFGYDEKEARRESQRCLRCGICSECYQCVDACLAKAIDHEQQSETLELEAGSVVLCPGSEPYDPSHLENVYHYLSSPNVMTSLEFERILSASGPTMGHLQRPSDDTEPKKIAWLQCVGSRDTNQCGNGYCSSVCCMYALKDAMIAKDHAEHDLDCVVFNMDIRSFGKDYEKYYQRAKDAGVRFVKSRVHSIDVVRETGDLSIRYVDEAGSTETEVFDIVVLSVGLQVPQSTVELAERIGVELDRYNFAVTHPFKPIETTRAGVFACGVFQQPKDIPSSVTEASAAACAAGARLAEARDTLTRSVAIPDEMDVSGDEPRIGVFVCNCGINISGVVDVPGVEEYARRLPNVVYSGQNLFTCSQDAQDKIKEVIAEHRLNRVVVAACTPKTHEPIFQDTLEACGLNKYLFEMANIRNQDSWVHANDHDLATAKAKDLVRMSVARAATLFPLEEKKIPVNQRGLVIGGGVAGMNAALGMAEQGYEVVLIEKEGELGGLAKRLTATIEGARVQDYLEELIPRVTHHPKIQVLTNSLITDFSGFKGNFVTEVLVGPGMYERKIKHGVVIVATGAGEYRPKEYSYGEDPRIMTQLELSQRLDDGDLDAPRQVVMIQCVGSRNEENPNCSRICCQSAIKNALHIKEQYPECDVYLLYRDIRTYGLLEEYYTLARQKGVLFFRFSPDDPPEATVTEDGVEVTFSDHILNRKLSVSADLLALSAGMRAEDTEELASIVKLARGADGYFMEAHVKLRPVDMATEGVFVCGTAHSPRLLSESISQAYAASARAITFLSRDHLTLSAVTAQVEADLCASCLICVRSCPYGVPKINEEGVSEIDEALCHGCGICAAECPAKAIQLNWYEDDQILCKVDALLEGVL
jgi:heterodisulfide reductase subunit A-like polyferredoxin